MNLEGMNLKGMWKIGSREWWWFNKKHIYCISLPEWVVHKAVCKGIYILRAFGFYATSCSCRVGAEPEKPMKFRLVMCKDCLKKRTR
jgi:hypothetical protein